MPQKNTMVFTPAKRSTAWRFLWAGWARGCSAWKARALSHFSLRHKPDVFNEPLVFSALWVKGQPHPPACWKARCRPGKFLARPARPMARAAKITACRAWPKRISKRASLRHRYADATRSAAACGTHRLEPLYSGDADNSSLPWPA